MHRLRHPPWLTAALLLVAAPAWSGELPMGPFASWLDHAPFTPLLFLLAYLLAQQLLLSSVAFNIIGGALFGLYLGTVVNLLGAMAGAALSFLISRHLLAARLTPHLPQTVGKVLDEVAQEGWRGVVFMRLLPGLPYAMLNYVLGLSRLSLRQFLLPTLLCIAPRVVLYTYLGHTGRAVLEGRAELVSHIIAALGLLVVLTWLPHAWRKLRAG